jgi:hypothetical protein
MSVTGEPQTMQSKLIPKELIRAQLISMEVERPGWMPATPEHSSTSHWAGNANLARLFENLWYVWHTTAD